MAIEERMEKQGPIINLNAKIYPVRVNPFKKKDCLEGELEKAKSDSFNYYTKKIGDEYYKTFLNYLEFENKGGKGYIREISKIAAAILSGYDSKISERGKKILEVARLLKGLKMTDPEKTEIQGLDKVGRTLRKIQKMLKEEGEEQSKEILKDAQTALSLAFVIKMDEIMTLENQEEIKRKWILAARRYITYLHEVELRKSAQLVGFALTKHLEFGGQIAEWWSREYEKKLKKLKKSIKNELEKIFFSVERGERPEIKSRVKDPYSIYEKVVDDLANNKMDIYDIIKKVDDVVGISIIVGQERDIRKTATAVLELINKNRYELYQINDYFHLGYKKKNSKEKNEWNKDNIIEMWKDILKKILEHEIKEKFISDVDYIMRDNNTRIKLRIDKRESGYRAIHLKILVKKIPIEIQITTHDLYKSKEFGRATHAFYKDEKMEKLVRRLREAFRISIRSHRNEEVNIKLINDENGEVLVELKEELPIGDILPASMKRLLSGYGYNGKPIVVDFDKGWTNEINARLIEMDCKTQRVVFVLEKINNKKNPKSKELYKINGLVIEDN